MSRPNVIPAQWPAPSSNGGTPSRPGIDQPAAGADALLLSNGESLAPAPVLNRPCFHTHDTAVMLDGQRIEPGLYWHGLTNPKGNAKPEPVNQWLASPIHCEAITSDEDGGQFGQLLRFRDTLGRWRSWAAPMAMLKGSGEELRGVLLSMGVRIDLDSTKRLNQWLMAEKPTRRVIATNRTGWHDNGQAFVTPTQTIGGSDVVFQSEYANQAAYQQRGTLPDWRHQVGEQCRGNPWLVLAVSTAFAGPLIQRAMNADSGTGIHLVGRSSQGKTTALQCAASVWGGPQFVRTWRATANGLEATAAALCDSLLVLDEISESNPKDIGAMVYALANGQGKQRAARNGGARQSAHWRTMVLSSGERTLSAHMLEAGQRSKAGQQARLLDVHATDRTYGLFDTLHQHQDSRALADHLKQATRAHYGKAGIAYLEALLKDTTDLPHLYAEARQHDAFQISDGIENRAAGVFALIGLAGELATRYGLTGWQEDEAVNAAVLAFNEWRTHRGTGQTEQRQVLEAVAAFIDRHGSSRFAMLDDDRATIHNQAGYWRDDPAGRVFYFHSDALTEAAPGHDQGFILDALEQAGWIAYRDNDKRSKKTSVQGQKKRLYAIRPVDPS